MHGHYYCTMCNEWRTATIKYREEQSSGKNSDNHIRNAHQRRRRGESAFKQIGTNTTNILNVQKQIIKRNETMPNKTIINSPGIMAANDPWIWQSNNPLYDVMPNGDVTEYSRRVREVIKPRTIFMIGDSLTRQWAHMMHCELMHVLGFSKGEAGNKVRFQRSTKAITRQRRDIRKLLQSASKKDIVVFNYGHHVGLNNGEDWRPKYVKTLENARDFDFGPIPDENIFFRTTSVWHFLHGFGDWNTESFTAGKSAPDMHAMWDTYGGNQQELPDQNLVAFSTLLDKNNIDIHRHRSLQILDTSPMMLARGDATYDYDEAHFCLPGPMEFWSRMLYLHLERQTRPEVMYRKDKSGTERDGQPHYEQLFPFKIN